MKTTSIISMLALGAATVAVTASSCSKKDNPAPEIQTPKPDDEGTPLPPPTAAGFAKLREDALKGMTAKNDFDTEDYKTPQGYYDFLYFTSDKGAISRILPGSFEKENGEAVTGNIELTFTEIYDRGSMALANRPLMGKNAAGKLVPLISGGQFALDAKQGDEPIYNMGTRHIAVKGSLVGGSSPVYQLYWDNNGPVFLTDGKMVPWKGSISNGNITWDMVDIAASVWEGSLDYSAVFYNQGVTEVLDGYELGTLWDKKHSWAGIGKPYVPDGQTTKIKVKVPDGYNAQNASVYLAYEGEKYLLAQLYSFDAAGKHFTEPDGFVPEGKKVHAIFVSESGGKFVLGIKSVDVTANAEISFAHKDLETIDPDELAKKVNALN